LPINVDTKHPPCSRTLIRARACCGLDVDAHAPNPPSVRKKSCALGMLSPQCPYVSPGRRIVRGPQGGRQTRPRRSPVRGPAGARHRRDHAARPARPSPFARSRSADSRASCRRLQSCSSTPGGTANPAGLIIRDGGGGALAENFGARTSWFRGPIAPRTRMSPRSFLLEVYPRRCAPIRGGPRLPARPLPTNSCCHVLRRLARSGFSIRARPLRRGTTASPGTARRSARIAKGRTGRRSRRTPELADRTWAGAEPARVAPARASGSKHAAEGGKTGPLRSRWLRSASHGRPSTPKPGALVARPRKVPNPTAWTALAPYVRRADVIGDSRRLGAPDRPGHRA